MYFSSKEGEFDRCFNGLDRPIEESRPDRFDNDDDKYIFWVHTYKQKKKRQTVLQ